ncbi:MAG: three-Cys-motif partner protein TcmP [Candidatus Rokuibacteriota bacterium]
MIEEVASNGHNASGLDEFFVEGADHSKVKTAIATKYFFTWASIIARKTRSDRIGYVDLYAGPGRFMDGTKSTPLLMLEQAIGDPRMRDMLVTYFNDGKPAHADSLEAAINKLPGIDTLKYKPQIDKNEVGPAMVTAFGKPLIPTFAFIDPYGYKGLSLGLVNAIIKDWACECLFFFNYNRINPGISNPAVTKHMGALFGAARLAALRTAIAGRSPAEREVMVMAALTEAQKELGGRFVVAFRFKMPGADRTSHYLVFVSKNFLGYTIMRDVMAKASSYSTDDAVASFEYTTSPPLFLPDGRSIEALAETLIIDLAGTMMTVAQVFERHSPDKLYVMPNYRKALLRLEEAGRVTIVPPAAERRPYRGKPSLPEDVLVTFPRLQGSGAKIEASRSTPDRRARALPTSPSVRPTA